MNPFPDVPDLILTERMELRAPSLADTAALTGAVRVSLPELQPWMPWATDDYDLRVGELGIRQAIAQFVTRTDLRYHMFDRGTGQLMGSTGLHRINWKVPRFEIGYWLGTPWTGRGYTTEASRALARTCFEQLGAKRVEIRCDDSNHASGAVAERCGFTLDGVLKNFTVGVDGSLRHERIYSLLSLVDLK